MQFGQAPRIAPIPLSRRRRVLTDLARIISTVFNPFLTALALFGILSHASAADTPDFWRLFFTCAFFTSIGPMLYVFWLYATDRIADLDMSVRSEREKVFFTFVLFYALGTLTLWLTHGPPVLIATMGAYTIAALVVQYITRYWKISTHALGITAPLVGLIYLYGPQPLPFLVLIPAVAWSRVYLRAHTVLQVAAGMLLGFVSVFVFYRAFRIM